MTTPKQSIAFPDAAQIRKGTPKQKMVKDGKTIEIQGKNLDGAGFRIHFAPGTEKAVAAWEVKNAGRAINYDSAQYAVQAGERNYIVKELQAIVPTRNVWAALNDGLAVNEAYSAGRRIALADDDQYITFRDPLTGELQVTNGQPYKKFSVGDLIKYERDGRKFEIKLKTSVRLRLVVKDMIEQGELVQFILKTTSWYDWQNIKKQLAGIQAIADTTSGGNASGIPFKIYRVQQEVVWNKPDGTARRVPQWLINIQPDPSWVKAAFARMGEYALSGGTIAGALLSTNEVVGEADPEPEEGDDEDTGQPPSEIMDGEELSGKPTYYPPLPNTANELKAIFANEFNAAVKVVAKGTKLPSISPKATPDELKEAIVGLRAAVAAATAES